MHTWCLGKDCEKMWMISSMWFSRCGLKKKSDANDDDDIWQLKVNPIHCDFILLRRSHKQYIKALVPLFAASCFWPTHFPTDLSPPPPKYWGEKFRSPPHSISIWFHCLCIHSHFKLKYYYLDFTYFFCIVSKKKFKRIMKTFPPEFCSRIRETSTKQIYSSFKLSINC